MRTRAAPLLCELHSHTTWSDGVLSTSALVDLYGQNGFDVLCVTDHVIRSDDPGLPGRSPGRRHVLPENHRAYLGEILREAERARRLYDLLVIPGLELTDNAFDPLRSAHALALGLHASSTSTMASKLPWARLASTERPLSAPIPTETGPARRPDERRSDSPMNGAASRIWSTATSSSTAPTSSPGWRRRACRASRPEISTGPSTSPAGRR